MNNVRDVKVSVALSRYSEKGKIKMTNLIIELPIWTIDKNDLSEIVNKMQAIALNIKKNF